MGPPPLYCSTSCSYKRYRAANPEKVRQRDILRYAASREAQLEQSAKRRADPIKRELAKLRSRAWYAANREKAREGSARYRAANPDRIRANDRRRKALKRQIPFEAFTSLEIFDRDQWVCQLCGLVVDPARKYPDPESASLDHIQPLSLGGFQVRANVQLAHLRCNLVKGANRSAK